MIVTFKPIKIWPEGWNRNVSRLTFQTSPFTASYSDTLRLLDRELQHLGATDIALQVDAPESACRLDGQLRADAKVNYPGVILSFRTKRFGTLTYPCNAFGGSGYRSSTSGWQNNLRAIALGLEALRKVERYGIAERGQQYAGWKELPSGIAMPRAMTVEEAAVFIAENSGGDWSVEIEDDPSFALALFKDAVKLHHPDVGGDPEVFRKLTEARDLLEAAS